MIRQWNTSNGIFRTLESDSAFHSEFSNGRAWDAPLIDSICSYLPNRGTILDVGGHIGTHAIPYSKRNPNATVYTFEPQQYIRTILEQNKLLNSTENLTVLPFGAGHCERKVRLANDFRSDGYSIEQKVDYHTQQPSNYGGLGITNDPTGEEIQLRTIDSFQFEDVTYIKIDIEGAETLAVYGARNTIERYRPILLIEQSDKNITSLYVSDCEELSTFSVTDYLLSLGYTKVDLGNFNFLYKMDKIQINLDICEMTISSESGEDGILFELFKVFNTTNKFYVEFGAEDGTQCNTRALREHKGFNGYLFDMNYENHHINLYKHTITTDNIIDIFKQYNIPNEIDLLSVDIDSHDFYVLEKILSQYSPRIIVCEYNATHLPDQDKIVKKEINTFHGNYFGASILSFYRLGRKYNYSLVYANQKGVNLFFVRDSVLHGSKYTIKNINDVVSIYRTPKYGKGPNGGHEEDRFHNEYINTQHLWDTLS